MITFYASASHFEDHLKPVFEGIQQLGFPVQWVKEKGCTNRSKGGFAVAASSRDLLWATRDHKRVFFFEHGAGQSYSIPHTSYAGGPGRENVCLFLSPGPHVSAKNKLKYPFTEDAPVGVPKLDPWHRQAKKELPPKKALPVVCFSFHWDCKVCPESKSGFEYFKRAIDEAVRLDEFKVVGHCHPRARTSIVPYYRKLGVPFIKNFSDVLDQADIYVCDNSSTMFEFASVGKPVVFLNPPHYRRFVNHGLRFWEFTDLGPNAWKVKDVVPAIREACDETQEDRLHRLKRIKEVYHYIDGKATQRAVEAILSFVEKSERMKMEGNVLKCVKTTLGRFGFLDPGQTIEVYEDHAIVNNTAGSYLKKIKFNDEMTVDRRLKTILMSAPTSFKLAEPDLAQIMEMEISSDTEEIEDYSGGGSEFEPAEKVLTAEELHIVQQIQTGASKTAIVYKSQDFKIAALQRAWSRLEETGIIEPGEEKYTWKVNTWGQ